MGISEYLEKPRWQLRLGTLLLMLVLLAASAICGCREGEKLAGRYRGANILLLVMDTSRIDHLAVLVTSARLPPILTVSLARTFSLKTPIPRFRSSCPSIPRY